MRKTCVMDAEAVVGLFNSEFKETCNTILVAGAKEPLYVPAVGDKPAQVFFKEDFVASAFHEVAHWCIAGEQRRRCVDYGYWYEHQRNDQLQDRFEAAEVEPQALEWIFSEAAGTVFRVSCDNFCVTRNNTGFANAIRIAALRRVTSGLPARGKQFASILAKTTLERDFLCPSTYRALPQF